MMTRVPRLVTGLFGYYVVYHILSFFLLQLTITAGRGYSILPGFQYCLSIKISSKIFQNISVAIRAADLFSRDIIHEHILKSLRVYGLGQDIAVTLPYIFLALIRKIVCRHRYHRCID